MDIFNAIFLRDIARELLKAGANVFISVGRTPVMIAAWLDRKEIVRELILWV